MSEYNSYVCPCPEPADCVTPQVLPTVVFADCPEKYQAHESEICDVWVGVAVNTAGVWAAEESPVDWTDPASYELLTKVQHLVTIGDKPLSETTEIIVAKRQVKITNRKHTVNIDVTDMSKENYEFIRCLQTIRVAVIWWRDLDGYMFGGADGVICDVSNAGNVSNRGEGGLLTGQGIFVWDADCDPPIALEGEGVTP